MLMSIYNFANIEVSLIFHYRQQLFIWCRVRNPRFCVDPGDQPDLTLSKSQFRPPLPRPNQVIGKGLALAVQSNVGELMGDDSVRVGL